MATHTCNQNCGCSNSYTVTAPCPPACPEVFNAQCIVYTGTDILCNQDTVIKRYDYLDTIITKLVNYICNVQAPITEVLGSEYIDVVPSTVGNVTTYTVSIDIPALQAYFDTVFQLDLLASILAGPGIVVSPNSLTGTVTISHADTSAVANLFSDNSGNSFIQDIFFTFDTYGHVTGASVVAGSVIPPNDFDEVRIAVDSGYTWGAANDPTNPQIAEVPSDTITLVAGTGVNLYTSTVPGVDAVKIENASPASSVTLASAGGTETLVNDGVGPALATKGLTAGTGIVLVGSATSVEIKNNDPGSGVALSDAGTGVHENLVVDGTGPSLSVKGLVGVQGVTTANTGTEIQIGLVDSVPRKYAASIDLTVPVVVVTHNLGTFDIILSLSVDGIPPYDHIQDDGLEYKYRILNNNQVEINAGGYSGSARVTIIG
jgi:hypothetical protein